MIKNKHYKQTKSKKKKKEPKDINHECKKLIQTSEPMCSQLDDQLEQKHQNYHKSHKEYLIYDCTQKCHTNGPHVLKMDSAYLQHKKEKRHYLEDVVAVQHC